MTKNPPTTSLASANGPSMTEGLPFCFWSTRPSPSISFWPPVALVRLQSWYLCMSFCISSGLEPLTAARSPLSSRINCGILYLLSPARRTQPGEIDKGPKNFMRRELFRFFLLLLADADLEVQLLGFEKRLVIVARDSISQKVLHAGALGKDHHHGEILVALRAEGSEPFDVGNGHNKFRISQRHYYATIVAMSRARDIKIDRKSTRLNS